MELKFFLALLGVSKSYSSKSPNLEEEHNIFFGDSELENNFLFKNNKTKINF